MSSNADVITAASEAPLIITSMEGAMPTSSTSLIQQLPTGKHQVVPVMYIQTPGTQKLNAVGSNNSVIISPQLQLQNMPMQPMNNQIVVGKGPPIVLKNAANMPKNGVTYLTMLKPVSKPPDNIRSASRLPIASIGKIRGESGLQKIMIAPMPSVTRNRQPVTATTNAVQSSKFSFVPLVQGPPGQTKSKIINLKISDNNVIRDDMKVVTDDLTITAVHEKPGNNVQPEDERSYELSIIEEEPEHAPRKTIIDDTLTRNKEPRNELKRHSNYQHLSVLKRNFPLLPKSDVKPTPISNASFSSTPKTIMPASGDPKRMLNVGKHTKEIRIRSSDAGVTAIPTSVMIPLKNTSSSVISRPSYATIPTNSNMYTYDRSRSLLNSSVKQANTTTTSTVKPPQPSASVSAPPPPPPPATKRSRKSTLCLRKDIHEMVLEAPSIPIKEEEEEDKSVDQEVDMITSGVVGRVLAERPLTVDDFRFPPMGEEFNGMLDWQEALATLPGTDLKFIINEFGLLEFVPKEALRAFEAPIIKAQKEKMERARLKALKLIDEEKKLHEQQIREEMRCLECGAFGPAGDFVNPKYCSMECLISGEKKALNYQPPPQLKTAPLSIHSSDSGSTKNNDSITVVNTTLRKRSISSTASVTSLPTSSASSTTGVVPPKKRKSNSLENGTAETKEGKPDKSDEEEVPSAYPWYNSKKGFSWKKYLRYINQPAAPVRLFKDPFPYGYNGFRPGMRLEGIDPQHPSYFCVLSVVHTQGYRVQLHFDGYPSCYDFWVNADSPDIFPAGFCEKHDHILRPPAKYTDFNWNTYLKQMRYTAAPKTLFTNKTQGTVITAFRTGMKLEAVDRKNTALVCVATVKDLFDGRILVHFDSWDDIYDYWADPSSPYIHPVGWCDKNGHNLTPPNDYPDPENFTWEKYLKETNSTAAPVRAFKQRSPCGFRKGMRLECVDKRVPQLVRVAFVMDVKDHELHICFDGWPDRYSYWVDEDSPDIHPIGWCQKTGHPIEPPLTPDDVYDLVECATVGCRGVGNTNVDLPAHTSQEQCPYADNNLELENRLPDRLLSPDRELQAVVPISREPKQKRRKKYETNATKTEWIDDDAELKMKSFEPISPVGSIKRELAPSAPPLNNNEIDPAEAKMLEKYSKHYAPFADISSNPRTWTVQRVTEYMQTLPFVGRQASAFTAHGIDGESLLMMSREDLTEVLNFKLGPAIALYNCIRLLRKHPEGV